MTAVVYPDIHALYNRQAVRKDPTKLEQSFSKRLQNLRCTIYRCDLLYLIRDRGER